MSDIPVLISDLAVILICAGLVTLLFKWLKQPVVLGYIVAGILSGPVCKYTPTVMDSGSIETWSEIGVIFLLFTLGLDFSFKKLVKVGGTAVIAAITVVLGMMFVGYATGLALGWGSMNSLFLGGMLSMSSTTIIYKAFDDMGLRNQKFSGVVLGILVVEDLFAVLMMVLLSTLAVSKHVEGAEMLSSVMRLGLFLMFCFIVGIYLVPSLLHLCRKYLNDETLLVVSLGLCLTMVMIAVFAGFSSALGAFIMGSLLAETVEAERIERLVKPVKDLFGAVFFVSVGMMIDPQMLWEYKIPILLLTLIVMVGQISFGTFGVFLSGQPMKVAVQSGFSLAQIGEFAFILAALGQSLKVTDQFLYPIVVAVSVITTFFTPYMIRFSEPAYNWLNERTPLRVRRILMHYSSGSTTIRQKSAWNKLLKALAGIVGVYASVTFVLIFVWLKYVSPLITNNIQGWWGNILSLVIILALISPLLRAIMMKKNRSVEFRQLWHDRKINRGPLISLILLRIILCVILVMIPVVRLLNTAVGYMWVFAALTVITIIFSKKLKKHSILMERHFLSNLTAREMDAAKHSTIRQSFANHILERDLHLADFEVRQNSPSVGKRLRDLDFRKICNVNVVTIVRGDRRINIPGGDERLYPFDKIVVVGADSDLEHFRTYIEEKYEDYQKQVHEAAGTVSIEQFQVTADSGLVGHSIRESGIRERAECLVIGIERGNCSLKNPDPTTCFEEGDLVWIVGERKNMLLLSEGKIA